MIVSTSDYLGIDASEFTKRGAFNPILEADSRFFIDPDLVRRSAAPEFSNAGKILDDYFADIMLLLKKSKQRGDLAWTEALKRFDFPEPEGLRIGYSDTTSGSAFGPQLRNASLEVAAEIIALGHDSPRIFELIGVFQKDVGCDRISDAIAKILESCIYRFSHRVYQELGVPSAKLVARTIRGEQFWLPEFKDEVILLLPMDILSTLPVATSYEDISYVCQRNDSVRQAMNDALGSSWKKQAREWSKRNVFEFLASRPQLLRDVIESYLQDHGKPYNFQTDPDGLVAWYEEAKLAVEKAPLSIPKSENVRNVVLVICKHFKELVESGGLRKILFDGTRPRKEESAQLLFFAIASSYCIANDLDITPEAKRGRGPVDFKVSKGNAKTLVELKLSKNAKLVAGYEKQLEIYKQAEKTPFGVYLVIDVVADKKAKARIKDLIELAAARAAAGMASSEIVLVDALAKPSASKL